MIAAVFMAAVFYWWHYFIERPMLAALCRLANFHQRRFHAQEQSFTIFLTMKVSY